MTDTPVEAYVITPEQLRARDERIIRAALELIVVDFGQAYPLDPERVIAQADEVDQ